MNLYKKKHKAIFASFGEAANKIVVNSNLVRIAFAVQVID